MGQQGSTRRVRQDSRFSRGSRQALRNLASLCRTDGSVPQSLLDKR
jgi:hypothetical protein